MSNIKKTKRALLSGVMAMVLSVAMLIGTTFAWFTDSASAGVSKIQAGTLSVKLVDENNNEITESLTWQKNAAAPADEAVLWEPGCTYQLQPFKIVNDGELALKYKIEIAGIDGDEQLNNVITWTYTDADGNTVDIDAEGQLAAKAETGLITVSATMQTGADNGYQGLSIDGVRIIVSATQAAVEYDSKDNQYDANAEYPVTEVTIDGIDFYVLKTEGSRMLLLTKNCVATKPFSTSHATTLWQDCDLRTWLNGEWLNSCSKLSAMAVETTLYTMNSSATNPEFVATQDKVFLLSEADINGTYHCDMNGGGGTSVTNADYYTAGEQLSAPDGTWNTSANEYWWTRSGNCWGDGLPLVSYWDKDDNEVHAQYSGLEIIGVRPALWVDTASVAPDAGE